MLAVGEPVAADVGLRHRQLRIDLLRAILVPQARVRHPQRGDQVVEGLIRFVGIGQRTRQVVTALLVHEIVDVHTLNAAGLDDVAATQQIGEAEIDLRPCDRREYRRVGIVHRPNADVLEVKRRLQQVVVEFVGLKLNVLLRQKRRDLVDGVAPNRPSVNREEQDDDDEAQSHECDQQAAKRSPIGSCHVVPRGAIDAPRPRHGTGLEMAVLGQLGAYGNCKAPGRGHTGSVERLPVRSDIRVHRPDPRTRGLAHDTGPNSRD